MGESLSPWHFDADEHLKPKISKHMENHKIIIKSKPREQKDNQ
jgi:hypothetical protein